MLENQTFYWGSIRKAIVAFGSLFSNIYIERRQGDSVTGEIVQKLQVPLAYAPKEKWLVRIDSDPTLTHNTYITLPRMSFEITGYSYDPERKVGRVNQLRKMNRVGGNTIQKQVYSPAPYNIDVSLYILTKTQEDGMQIIEQILPYFTPEFNLSTLTLPNMGVSQDIPVILNNVNVQDDYDGDFQTRRFVTHTLNFTMKINMFGNVTDAKEIRNVFADVKNPETVASITKYEAELTPNNNLPTDTPININESWADGL